MEVAVAFGLGVVTLLLGGIGTMNVMLVAVRERTREIGLRKAVGATSREILTMFFLETAIIVFVSGGLGMAFAHTVCHFVNKLPMPQFFAGLWATWEVGAVCVMQTWLGTSSGISFRLCL